ncbi:MAG TPA: helix-turn-helix domain-containing protein [Nevskia sp.]|nr:helix-turn-helix domain-containing protein [Nevskia sp.]
MAGRGAQGVPPAAPRRVPVYTALPPRLLLLDVAGPMEVLRRANLIQDAVRFELRYIGPRAALRSSVGLRLCGIEPLPRSLPDGALLIVPGSVDQPTGDDGAPLPQDPGDAAQEQQLVEWLRAAVAPQHTLVTICSGAMLAARAGLLDGYACTTHHSDVARLAALASQAQVLDNRLYVEDRGRYSSAGVTAGIDLMLHLLARYTDHGTAVSVARYLVVYLRRGGAEPQLSPWLEGRNHLHPAVHRAQDAVAGNPARRWTLGSLARIAGASPRHLSRLFNEHAGMSITDYTNRLRVALARELLSQTRLDMERVAERAGFASTRQLRRAWGRLHDGPPRQARAG